MNTWGGKRDQDGRKNLSRGTWVVNGSAQKKDAGRRGDEAGRNVRAAPHAGRRNLSGVYRREDEKREGEEMSLSKP